MRNKILKVLSIVLSFAFLITSVPYFALAADNSTDEPLKIEIKSNKTSYNSIDIAKITVKITNVSNNTIDNISAEALFNKLVPVGRNSKITAEAASLEAGESMQFKLYAMLDTDAVNTSFLRKAFINLIKFFVGTIPVTDNGFDDGRSCAEQSIELSYGNNDTSVDVCIWYESNIIFTVNPYQNTSIDVNVSLNGTVSSDSGIDSVSYVVKGETDTDETATKGFAVISYDTWEAQLKLKTGNNNIKLIAKTVSGYEKEIDLTIYYDIGSITVLPDSMIATEENVKYYQGVLLVYFDNYVSDENAKSIISSYGGQVIGQNNLIKMYQCKFNITNYSDLESLASRIKSSSGVSDALIDEIVEDASISISDPWNGDVTNNDWTDSDVDGSNWGLEAIEIYDVWNSFGDRLEQNPTRVGVVDSGFSLSHEELNNSRDNINVSLVNADGYNSNLSSHGTHVAGTIAASPNNSRGITGIVWNANLLLASAGTGVRSLSGSLIQDGFTRTVVNGAKVINFSLGSLSNSTSQADESARYAAIPMVRLLEQGYDFLCVQSAGNDRGTDASFNGWFSSFRPGLSISDLTTRFSMNDLINRSVIVAAVSNDYSSSRGYRLANYSNQGSRIDIAAPGSDIYSCTWSGYDSYNGTSMAAPHVTAVASLIWSINHEFSAPEIKSIICSNSTTTSAYGYYNSNSYRMLNARLAVEEAVRLTDAMGTVYGNFVDAETGYSVENGTFVIYKDNIQGERYDNITYSFENGSFRLELPSGKYVLEVKSNGYTDKYATVVVEPFETLSYGNIPMTKTLSDNQMRIVLSWGETPRDLDSHIIGKTKSGESFHVAYYNKSFSQDQEKLIWLDVDDTSSYGPETVTILDLDKIEEFEYCVHNYTQRDSSENDSGAFSLADSYAKIDVYVGSGLVASYDVPANRKGTVWNVFKMNSNGRITRINTFEFESDPDLVGNEEAYYSVNSIETAAIENKKRAYEK